MISPLLVSCALGFGSAAAITPDTFISAAHVFENDVCQVAGRSFEVVMIDSAGDILIGRVQRPFDHPSPVSCAPLVTGDRYRIAGATARPTAIATETYYDVRTARGVEVGLRGVRSRTKAEGLSGAAVVDETGTIRGFVTARAVNGIYGVREFAGTTLCNPAQEVNQ